MRCGSDASAGCWGLCALGCGCDARRGGAGGQRAAWLRARSAIRDRAAGTVRPGDQASRPQRRPGAAVEWAPGLQALAAATRGSRRAAPESGQAPRGGWGRRSERAGPRSRPGPPGRQQPGTLIWGIRRAFSPLLLSRCPYLFASRASLRRKHELLTPPPPGPVPALLPRAESRSPLSCQRDDGRPVERGRAREWLRAQRRWRREARALPSVPGSSGSGRRL